MRLGFVKLGFQWETSNKKWSMPYMAVYGEQGRITGTFGTCKGCVIVSDAEYQRETQR